MTFLRLLGPPSSFGLSLMAGGENGNCLGGMRQLRQKSERKVSTTKTTTNQTKDTARARTRTRKAAAAAKATHRSLNTHERRLADSVQWAAVLCNSQISSPRSHRGEQQPNLAPRLDRPPPPQRLLVVRLKFAGIIKSLSHVGRRGEEQAAGTQLTIQHQQQKQPAPTLSLPPLYISESLWPS